MLAANRCEKRMKELVEYHFFIAVWFRNFFINWSPWNDLIIIIFFFQKHTNKKSWSNLRDICKQKTSAKVSTQKINQNILASLAANQLVSFSVSVFTRVQGGCISQMLQLSLYDKEKTWICLLKQAFRESAYHPSQATIKILDWLSSFFSSHVCKST